MFELKNEINNGSRVITPTIMRASQYWIAGVMAIFVISPTDIALEYRLIVVAIYALFFAYPLTHNRWGEPSPARLISYRSPALPILLVLLIIQYFGIIYSMEFYTGSNVSAAFQSAINGENSYGDYQRHLEEQVVGGTNIITRLPFIVFLALSKLITIFFVANFFLSAQRAIPSFVALVLSSLIYLTFGLARGTFFEVFELAVAYAYFGAMTSNVIASHGRVTKSKAFRFIVLVAPFALISFFAANAMRRYGEASTFLDQCSPNFCYSSSGLPIWIEQPLYLLSVYFGNGAYFIAQMIEATFSHNEFGYLLPMQSIIVAETEFGVRDFMCGVYTQCEFVWSPEMATIISIFGIFSVPMINHIFYLCRNFESLAFSSPDIFKMLILYFLVVFLLSLPVANFLLTSSSSIVALATLIGVAFLRRSVLRSIPRSNDGGVNADKTRV